MPTFDRSLYVSPTDFQDFTVRMKAKILTDDAGLMYCTVLIGQTKTEVRVIADPEVGDGHYVLHVHGEDGKPVLEDISSVIWMVFEG